MLIDLLVSTSLTNYESRSVQSHITSIIESNHLIGEGSTNVLISPHQSEGAVVDHLQLNTVFINRRTSLAHNHSGSELYSSMRTMSHIHGHTVETSRSSTSVTHYSTIRTIVINTEETIRHCKWHISELTNLKMIVTNLHISHTNWTKVTSLILHRTNSSHHISLTSTTSQTMVLTSNTILLLVQLSKSLGLTFSLNSCNHGVQVISLFPCTGHHITM